MHCHGIHTPFPRQSKRATCGISSEQFVDKGRNQEHFHLKDFPSFFALNSLLILGFYQKSRTLGKELMVFAPEPRKVA